MVNGDPNRGEIYVLTNLLKPNEKYVGKALKLTAEKRWDGHIGSALNVKGTPRLLVHRAIRKAYNHDKCLKNFSAEVVEVCTATKLSDREKYYIKKFHTFVGDPEYVGGYNLTEGGEGSQGFKHKISSIKKMSKTRSLLWENETYAAHMSAVHKGATVSPKTRAAISKKLVGHGVSLTTRQAQSDGNKRALIANPARLGKLKAGLHCKPHTDTAKEKMRQAALGKTMPAATRAKIAATLSGRIVDVETRLRMAEGVTRWWAARKLHER
jgi:group I intron endonuclease